MSLQTIKNIYFWGNSGYDWLIAVLVLFLAYLGLKIFKGVIIGRLKKLSQKTETRIDDMLIDAINSIHKSFYLLVPVYTASLFVNVHHITQRVLDVLILAGAVFYAVRFLEKVVDHFVKILIEKQEEGENQGIIRFGGTVVKVVLWLVAVLLLLSNLGYNVTSLIAGLGIGGVAVALALQSILGDLFSSLTILFDKPFKVGDFIVVGDNYGTVLKVGIKSTRIQLLQGEELVVSNSDLTGSRIRNFGTLESRRIVFNLGADYSTPIDKLKKIPDWIKQIILSEEKTEVERVNFKEFGDSDLNFEVVFYVHSSDYIEYMDIRERINLAILDKLEKEGVDIAFPTQTINLNKN